MNEEREKLCRYHEDHFKPAYHEFLDAINGEDDRLIIRRGTIFCITANHLADQIKHNRYAILKGEHIIPNTNKIIYIDSQYITKLENDWPAYKLITQASKATKHLKVIGPGKSNYESWLQGEAAAETSLGAIAVSRLLPFERIKKLKITIISGNTTYEEDLSKAIDDTFQGFGLILKQISE